MPVGPANTDDISPQLSKEEAVAIMKGGLADAELALVTSFCAPLYWALGRDGTGNPIVKNGTAFFMNAGEGCFGVTAQHVVKGWAVDREAGCGPLCIATDGNPLVIEWPERAIDAHSAIDIATFRVSAEEVSRLGKTVLTGFQKNWPPKPPAVNCGVYYCGYPQIGTRPERQGVSFGAVRGSGVADSVNDRDVVCLFQRQYWIPDPIHGAPPPNFDFGGISGGLMLTVIQTTAIRSWALSGVIYEGPSTSGESGDAITDFEILRARRAYFLNADGTLDTALWHSLGGHDNVPLY